MPSPAQIIHGLPPLSWRNLQWPHVESAPVHFSHSQAERKYPYVDAAGHDNTGRDPLVIRVRMFFLETLEPGAFTKKWPVWRKALFDGSSGPLEHPLLGVIRARVLDGDVQFAAQTTAGIIVDVTFTETIDSVDKPNKLREATPGKVEVAKAAQVAANQFQSAWPSQKLNTSLLDAVKAIETAMWDTQMTAAGFANQVAGDILVMIEAAETLTDPTAFPAYDNLVFLWDLVKSSADAVSKDLRPTAARVVQNDTTIATFAAEVGNTENEIMSLNTRLLRSPLVPRGTSVSYYSGK